MAKKKTDSKKKATQKSPPDFEDFDVAGEGGAEPEEFEAFDPTAAGNEAGVESESAALYESLSETVESEARIDELAQARAEVEDRFLVDPTEVSIAAAEDGEAGLGNVVGVGIGAKEVGGHLTGEVAVKVFVREKLPREAVSAEALVPQTVAGLETDVEATGDIYANRFTGRFRPAPGGVSIGHCGQVMAGTLGCLVYEGTRLYVLSNNHVMAAVNRGPVGALIPQPGRLDGGVCGRDVIARLTRWVPIVFGGAPNLVDAAIARVDPRQVDRRIYRGNGVLARLRPGEVWPKLFSFIQKSGRTTQYRLGVVDAVMVAINVSYAPQGGVARFVNQFRARGVGGIFSDRGDSGSLVTTFPQNQPAGLLFAGNASANTTFFNPIHMVLNAFGVKILY